MSFLARLRRLRRGSSMAEMMVAGGILAAGVVPLFGYWVKLTHDTGSVTARARAFRVVQEVVDRYQAMGPVKLLGLAGADGELAVPQGSRAVAAQGRLGAALMLDGAGSPGAGIAGAGMAGLPGAGIAGSGALAYASGAGSGATIGGGVAQAAPAKVRATLTREDPLLKLVVESVEFPGLKVERLLPQPIEPAAPAWQ